MIIRSLSAVPSKKVNMEGAEGVTRQLPIGNAENTPHFSFRVFTVAPGGHTPYHVHSSEHVNYIISGQGAVKDEQGELHLIGTGDFCLINPNEKHQYRNLSQTEELVLICAVMKEYE